MTTSSAPAGKATLRCSRLRVSIRSALPPTPRLAAIWSITPTRTPTNSFSARWPRSASSTSSSGRRKAARSARSTATSSAALEARPAPIGTLDARRRSKPRISAPSARSAHVSRLPVLGPAPDAAALHLGDAHPPPLDAPPAVAPLDRDAPLGEHHVTHDRDVREVEGERAREDEGLAHQAGEGGTAAERLDVQRRLVGHVLGPERKVSVQGY